MCTCSEGDAQLICTDSSAAAEQQQHARSTLYLAAPAVSLHLQSWDRYREMELAANKQLAVTDAGDLLEYETLVSRLLPPNVKIDNELYEVGQHPG